MKSNIDKIYNMAIKIHEDRSNKYGNSNIRNGKILKALFPEGLHLLTEEDFTKWMFFGSVLGKLSRYSEEMRNGEGTDSMLDLLNYAAMLIQYSEEQDERRKNR